MTDQPTERVASEPVRWQRRLRHPLNSAPAGSIPRWQECSKREATGHFEREPGYEYRGLYTAAQLQSELAAQQAAIVAMRDDLEMACELIQAAKGFADGPDGGAATDHLDAAESWINCAIERGECRGGQP